MRRMASWETPWMSLASFVIVLWMISIAVCGDALGTSQNSNLDLPSTLPCPDPEIIFPCVCRFNATLGMAMDCSNVTSEDELRRVFSNDFPLSDFWKFNITNNQKIQSLREGDIGDVTFKEIHIEDTSLSVIEATAFKGSFLTLITLHVCKSGLKAIPVIANFLHLETLELYYNQIKNISIQASATLLYLDLEGNQIDDVPEDSVRYMTKLETLYLNVNSLTEIHPHTFTRNEHLRALDLGSNKLTTIPDDAITLHGIDRWLFLIHNQITSLTHEAVSSVSGYNGELLIFNNNLTEVPEKVFRPLLEDSVTVLLYDNPFKCGCDMAWLVLNQTLLKRLSYLDRTTCSDGEYFTDLDPEEFKVMCPNATDVPLKLQ